MPDITISVKNLKDDGDAERLERALSRLEPVKLSNVDAGKGLAAVSYEGGESELVEIEATIEEAGFEYEATPGARKLEGG
jgi:copper chaperone CopZ